MQILMCIKGSAVDLADADGNVGAVVGNPFEVGHHIGKDKTKLDRAFSTLEPFDVVVFQAGIQAVNHLLEWFHFICFFTSSLLKTEKVRLTISLTAFP